MSHMLPHPESLLPHLGAAFLQVVDMERAPRVEGAGELASGGSGHVLR